MTSADAQLIAAAINRLCDIAELIFRIPPGEQLLALFSVGFVTPMTLYLVSYGAGLLVNFWRD
ncbi:hypothetical protein [Oxalicibacterium faecigallinarum]|uniref:Uncharacterized protein n=1 Tax=Oxalicibacterium faecigallinarum TaxID=573741 RepID=A0A8J3AVQ0_9BURK|nr:hypothetical protein [Oxalicibacterium faecigallinarum]GGI21073.1 hypothetical protein GCM10008066_27240 [Oxalicibacterium faecigallinarum]